MDNKKDESVGKLFKELRLSKNFSRDEAADGVMTASFLSRFESGGSMLGFEKVHRMLRNINVSLLEYDEIYSRTGQK